MLTKRIIPCLDVDNGRVMKGVSFSSMKDAGDPVTLAKRYYSSSADELVFLDIRATLDSKNLMLDVIKNVAKEVFIPLTVGGGIKSIGDIRLLLKAGADKVSLNSAAVRNPSLISSAASIFGRQCIVVAIDAKRIGDSWSVFIDAGTISSGLDAIEWAKKAESLGAGEILLTSIDRDGTNSGYDIALLQAVSSAVSIPVIASGGAGTVDDLRDAFEGGNSDGALIASVLHYNKTTLEDIKKYLKSKNIQIR